MEEAFPGNLEGRGSAQALLSAASLQNCEGIHTFLVLQSRPVCGTL